MAYWHFIDLTGLKVNSLTVIQLSIGGNGIPLQWECKCDCGNTCVIPAARIRNWKAKSCGKCIKRTSHNFIDLTGQKFNRLRVVSMFQSRGKRGCVLWNCICDCGRDKVAEGTKLKTGRTKSCGCTRLKMIGDSHFIDLLGQKFSMLTVVSLHSRNKNGTRWNCLCECGHAKDGVKASNLKSGGVKSCGCLGKENLNCTTHGMSGTKLETTLVNMKQRCYNPLVSCYPNYGGNGIKICKDWLEDAANFYKWALLNGYKEGLTIERIDCNKDYCPENCTWIPLPEQARNRRIALGVVKAREIKFKLNEGQSCLSISKEYNVDPSTISNIKRGLAYSYIEV